MASTKLRQTRHEDDLTERGRFDSIVGRWVLVQLCAVAAIALGFAMQIGNGSYHPRAIFWLTISITSCLAIFLFPRIDWLSRFKERPVIWLLAAGFAFQIWQLMITPANNYFPYPAFYLVISIVLLLFLLIALMPRWSKGVQVPLLFLIHFALGVWVIKSTPNPPIDVFLFHKQSLEALLHGINPYTLSIPNIYEASKGFYGEGVVVNGRVNVGFPYPPLSLLLALPGHLIGGDYRYSNLAAMTMSGFFMAYARPSRVSMIAAVVFLFTPRVFYLLELGWTEPLVVLLLTATIFCAWRAPRLLPFALGLLFAVKQYAVLTAPFVFFLLPGPFKMKDFLMLLGKATLVAALVTLPAFLINAGAFFKDVVAFQFRQPFRLDSLSYLAWIAQTTGKFLPAWLGFATIIPTTALVLKRGPRTPAGFAAAVALVFLVFFAFSKQAFGNYYYFCLGALCCAIAVTGSKSESVKEGARTT